MSYLKLYGEYLKGYADARLGRYRKARGHKAIEVTVEWHNDLSLTINGTVRADIEIRSATDIHHPDPIELAPIQITRKQVEDDWAPRILDERLPLWRAAVDQPVKTP